MKNFDVPYVDNNTYPKRLDDCLESLCQQAGLVLGSKNFPNNSYMIKGNPFTNGETRKTVLSNLVQLTGGFAEVDIEDGKLYVRNLDVGGEPVETIDGNNYDEFKPNNVFGPVNSIRILMNSSVEGEETIKEADGVTDENRCQITIADNYYLTSAEERETVINGIFNALNGLTYLPVEINYYGYPWLKLGSKIKVKDKNDNEYITYVMEHTLKYNGAYSGKIKATALTKTQVAYKETTSLKQFKRNTELAVDKINGKITEIIEEQSDQSNKLVQIEKDINGVTTKVSSVETQVTNITNTQAQAEGKNIHIDDSAEEPFVEVSLHGETSQKTRSGKNFFDKTKFKAINNATYTYSNGIYAITPLGTANVALDIYINLPAGTYTYSGNGSDATQIKNSSGTTIANNVSSSNTTFTITEEGTYIRFNFGTGTSTDAFTFDTNNIQIESGSTATDYEEYGVMPSPDYPSEIENIEGKNLNSGLRTGYYKENTGKYFSSKNYSCSINPIYVKKGASYAFSIDGLAVIGYAYAYDKNNNYLGRIYINQSNGYLYIPTEDVYYFHYAFKDGTIANVPLDSKAQIEEGIVATEYVPYNSLAVKVTGKNIFDNKWTGTISTNFIPVFAGKHYIYSESGIGSAMNYRFYSDINGNYTTTYVASRESFIPAEDGYVKLYKTTTTKIECMLEEGTEPTDYEPYKSQVVTFPLGEEKLMEGSYLADDGVHNVRKQVVLDGSDDENWTANGSNQGYGIVISGIGGLNSASQSAEAYCNLLKADAQAYIYEGTKDNIFSVRGGGTSKIYVRFDSSITTVALLREKLAASPITVEYELAEPETVPYTAEQQEAREKLKALTTYKNVTNITSTAYAKVTYMRDNGLDVYETKQNAEKNYTETTKKLAEQKITVDEISQEVTNVNENLKGNYYTKTETNSKINEKADSITSEVSKTYSTKTETETAKTEAINSANSSTDNKLNDYTETSKLGTFIEQNYEHVKVAWNQISEFIQMMILNSNASLAILDGSKKPLMALDKTGMHFYNFSEQEIGNIGINNAEISFYVNGDVSGSSMSWGICKTVNGEKKYFQVFSYEGYNTEEGTEFGGKFLLEAPLIMQENTLFLGQSINSSYIQGQETDGRKKTTIGNTDDLYIYNTNGDLIFVLNSSYLKLYEQLEMYADPLATGGYAFNLMDNTLVGIDSISASGEISSNNGTFNDIPNSDNVRRFNNTGTDYLIAVLKSSAGGGSIYCQNANSDKKFKKNIKDTEIKALDIIKQIQHRQFDWKENGKHEKIGFIAQELEKINPCLINVIKENDEKTYLLNEKAILATVTKAIQEQQKEIEDLKKEIEKLKENKIEEV